MTTVLEQHNLDWFSKFQSIKASIMNNGVKEGNLVAVEHMGSTSIPGLIAKPQIDLVVTVRDLKEAYFTMKEAGYEYKSEFNIPVHLMFKPSENHDFNIKSNIHLYDSESPEPEINRRFRDLIKENADLHQEYQTLKERIAQDPDSRSVHANGIPKYNLMKSEFIKSCIQQSGFDGFNVKFAHYDEDFNYISESFGEKKSLFGYQMILFKGIDLIGGAIIEPKRSEVEIYVEDDEFHNEAKAYFEKRIRTWLDLFPTIY